MAWKSEVIADSSNTWTTNACVFATKEEADAAGHELMSRWFAVREHRPTEVNDAVNYIFDFAAYRPKRIEETDLSRIEHCRENG
jgi:hypothetical protein